MVQKSLNLRNLQLVFGAQQHIGQCICTYVVFEMNLVAKEWFPPFHFEEKRLNRKACTLQIAYQTTNSDTPIKWRIIVTSVVISHHHKLYTCIQIPVIFCSYFKFMVSKSWSQWSYSAYVYSLQLISWKLSKWTRVWSRFYTLLFQKTKYDYSLCRDAPYHKLHDIRRMGHEIMHAKMIKNSRKAESQQWSSRHVVQCMPLFTILSNMINTKQQSIYIIKCIYTYLCSG